MKFCDDCNNLLEFCLKKDTLDPLYKCSRCSNITDVDITTTSTFEFNKEVKKSEIINTNGYFIYDPTIPEINSKNIKCVNSECDSLSSSNNSIKYIKYNEDDLKYMYICTTCGQKWHN